MLTGRDIVLGVSGGIAVYKAVDVARRLRKLGATVHVIMTENACKFVAPLTFESLSGHPVVVDMFKSPERWEVEHIALAKRAELFVIAPATANILAKMANGIGDDMLSTTVMATRAPILVAPAMNSGMWDNPATQRNMDCLRGQGVHVIGPETGMLANGDSGTGRMSEPEDIVEAIGALLQKGRDLTGKRVLVTAGPTRERLDPVRFLSNFSSGKMGYAIAERAAARGAQVTLISGPVSLSTPPGVTRVDIESTLDLYNAMLERADVQDAIVQAAAPADYRPAVFAEQKMKKTNQALTVTLEETPDVAAMVGSRKQPHQVLVAFAAETQNLIVNAREKLHRKNADLLVANDVTQPGAGFEGDTNIVTFIDASGTESLPLMPKRAVADALLDRVAALLREKQGEGSR